MESELSFESRIELLDPTLYDGILSQTSYNDRRSLLALQNAARSKFGSYVYLEIGSYRGGSIQSHLLDRRCRKIYSIDKRPPGDVPDMRGPGVVYTNNSTQEMLNRLRQLAPDQVNKITCFDTDAHRVPAALIEEKPHLCFIDGEHTNRAVYSDFQFCLSVCDPNALIVFHDADLIYKGIAAVLMDLCRRRVDFAAIKMHDIVYCIGLNNEVINDEVTKSLAEDGMLFIKDKLIR